MKVHRQKLSYRLDGEKGNNMETIYRVVRKEDHSFVYAIFDTKLDAQAYVDYKNKWAGYELTETTSVAIDLDIYEDLFYPMIEQREGYSNEDG